MTAIWLDDYEPRTEKPYRRPACPECEDWVRKDKDGVYRCFACGKAVEPKDEKMREWLDREGERKMEWEDCKELTSKKGVKFGCGWKKCVAVHYIRNKATLEWEVSWGRCFNCGMRFIV